MNPLVLILLYFITSGKKMRNKGRVIYQQFLSREKIRSNPDKLYVFGDNIKRIGFGGQAMEVRGEPNSVGIPTKWSPGNSKDDFFSDEDFSKVKTIIDEEFEKLQKHILSGFDVVVPSDGVGTGLSKLPLVAPLIFTYIESKFAEIETLCEEDKE